MDDKKKQLLLELIRYCICGGIAFVCDLATKTLFRSVILPDNMGEFWLFSFRFEYDVIIATTVGFIVGLIVNYLISIFFVFTTEEQKSRGKSVKAFLIYCCVSVVGLLINLSVTQLGCNLLDATREDTVKFMLISCVAAGVALIWNYIGRKIFVYRGE